MKTWTTVILVCFISCAGCVSTNETSATPCHTDVLAWEVAEVTFTDAYLTDVLHLMTRQYYFEVDNGRVSWEKSTAPGRDGRALIVIEMQGAVYGFGRKEAEADPSSDAIPWARSDIPRLSGKIAGLSFREMLDWICDETGLSWHECRGYFVITDELRE